MHRTLSKLCLKALYFSRFITTTVPAELCLLPLGLPGLRIPVRFIVYLLVCVSYIGVVLFLNPSRDPLSNILFYFSFVPPFLAMMSTRWAGREDFAVTYRFMVFIFAVTVADGIAMNTSLRPYMWFFQEGHAHEVSNIFGFYQRPEGVAGLTSSSAATAVFSLVLSDLRHQTESLVNRRVVIVLLTLIVLESETGFAMFAIYVLVRMYRIFRSRITRKVGSIMVIMAVIGAIYSVQSVEHANQFRFSVEYARQVLDYKLVEWNASSFGPPSTLIWGAQIDPTLDGLITSSDFAVLGLVTAMGLLGGILVLSAPLVFLGSFRGFFVPTLFFYLCFVHYPALSSPPGAVLFALYLWLLAKARRDRHRKVVPAPPPRLDSLCA
jgi:hypothetical protein